MKKTALFVSMLSLLCALFLFCAAAESCPDGRHNFGPWEDVIPASCDGTGTQERVCKDCGARETQKSSALAHEYLKEYTVDVPATCTEEGSKSYHCKHCGRSQPGSTVEIPATGHSFGDWIQTTPPTCTIDGVETRTCENCGEKENRAVAALGHERVTVPAKAPTCTENGNGEGVYCKRCNLAFEEAQPISALGHDMIDDPAKEATCTEDGLTAGRHCSRCDYVQARQQTIPKKGHKTVRDPAVPSTCSTHGKSEGSHCSVCGAVIYESKELPLLPHQYVETVVKKTCTTDGYHQFTCKVCGDYYRENIDYAYGHTIVVEKAVEETCTKDGVSVRTYCSVCGEVLEESQVIPARGHHWVKNVTPATRKTNGKIVTVCSDCGKKDSAKSIPKIATIELSKTRYYCDGKKKTPGITVKDAKGKKLVYKKDYKTSWDSGRKNPGVYYVTVTFMGNYKDAKTLRFRILLPKATGVKVTPGKGSAKVSWKKTPGAKSYIVYICETKDGKYKRAGTTKKTALNVKKLTGGQTYYFIVRATTTDAAGKTINAAKSAVSKAKIK